MWRYAAALGVLLMMVLSGCSRQDEEAGSADSATGSGHVWEEQVQTIDKARQVEQDVMDAQKRRTEALQKQEY